MKARVTTLCAAVVLAAGVGAGPAAAQNLLGGGLFGSNGGNIADVDSGRAGNSALVNAGLGSDSNAPDNVADVRLGTGSNGGLLGLFGGNNGTTANVAITGGNGQGGLLNNGGVLGTGLLDGDDDGGVAGSGILGSNMTAGLDLRGLGLNVGASGSNGSNGGNGGNGIGGNDGRMLVGSTDGAFQVNCSVNDGRQVLQLASQAKLNPNAWTSAANVQVVPVKLCAQARAQVAQIFAASGKIQQLQRAAAGDALITASLNRTRYDANDVFAVQATGGRLMVYVY